MTPNLHRLPPDWSLFMHAERLAEKAVEQIVVCAKEAIAQRGQFHLVTAGGTTPNRCYELLRDTEQDWSRWFIYMGDERVLPLTDKDRNSVALHQAWLSFGKIPAEQIFYMPTELGLQPAVAAYSEVVQKIALFDLVLLGMGEDGHSASLFPGHDSVNLMQDVIAETQSPKPPAQRVSLSYTRLNRSRNMLKLISGKSKYEVLQAWLNGAILPINQLYAEQHTWVYLDESAWFGD